MRKGEKVLTGGNGERGKFIKGEKWKMGKEFLKGRNNRS